MKKLALQLIFGFFILPLSLVGTLYYLDQSGFFNISTVEVILESPSQGQEQFLRPQVVQLEDLLAKYKGMSLWNIKLRQISREVSRRDWVENLNIKRSWPSTLSVRIQPYEVKLLFISKNGKLIPIIKDGSFLNPIDSQHAPDVALLDGETFLKKSELRKKAVDVIEQIPSEGAFSKKTISEIRHDDKEGFWLTMIKTGVKVKLGEEQVALKSARVSQVVDYLEAREFDARVIDANLSKKVLVRLRKDP